MKKFIRIVGVLLSVGVAFARGSFAAESVTPTIPASAYIQDGLIAMWDGIENAGAGQHDDAATEWVDLTGKAFNWSVSSTGQWTEFGLRAKSDSNIATHGMPFKDFRTVEVRFDHSESTAERYLICWGDTTNKRCLSEHKTGSYGGPAFLMAHNEQTQCLVSESTNTVVGVYDAGDVLSCYVNGGPAVASGTKDTWSNKGTSCFLLRPTGKSFFAIRCYDRELSATEIAYNATIDKIRYEGEDPSTIEWPDGFKYENGQIYYRVTVDAGAGTASFDNTSFNSTISKWLPMGEEATITAYVRPSGSQVFVAVRGVDSSSIANNVVTFKASLPTTATLRYNSGEHPTTGMSARNYIQKGLMGHWDGIETGAFGYKTDDPTVWVDLSNKAFDWTVNLENGEWTDLGLRALNANRMATFDRAYMLFSTIEVVFEHDDTAAERYILCWGDTSSKRMLCETMTNSSRFGGPAFLFYTGGYTQYLIANGTNTCAAVYNGFYASTTLNSSYCNGVPSTSTGKTDNFGNEGTSCYLLRPAGKSYFAIRLYDRQLSAGELAFNSAIDDVRYRGADPTTYDWPEGYKYENGQLYYRVSATSEVGQVSFDGSSYSSYVEDWVPMNEARNYTLYVQDAAGYFFDHVDGLPQGTVYEQKVIPFTAEGVIAAVAAYRAPVEQAFTTADYAQDGLIGFWDGIENYGPNDHFANAKIWKDLSGQAFDWTIQDFYAKWIDLGLCSTQSPASDWSMAMANSSVAYKNFVTAEIVFDQSESAPERYLICWGDTTNKRMLSEHKTGGNWGGPAFLMTTGGQTQYLEAEGTNTVVGIYTGDTLTANYVNGELAQGTGKIDNFSSKGSACYLTRPQGKSFFAIRLYNRALTPVEIERHCVLDSIRYKGIVPEGYLVQDGKIYARVKVASTDGTQITINDEPLTEHDIWIELGHATTIRATANVASDKIATWEGLPSGASATATTVDFTISSAATITMTPKTVEFVEYVESNTSDGSQYIDMGTHFTAGHRLTLEWSASSLDGLSGENAGWGTGVDNAHLLIGGGRISSGNIRPYLVGNNKDFTTAMPTSKIIVGDRWVDVCEVSDKVYYTTTHVADGQNYAITPVTSDILSTYDSGKNICLFKSMPNSAQSGKKRIYHALYEDVEGNKVMDLIPAKIGGVPAMLDLLTMKPYYSAGTASLVASETLSNRYRYNDGKVECLVTVTSTAANPVSVNEGVFVAATNAWVEFGSPVTVECQVADHYRFVRWEGAPQTAIVSGSQISFTASPCAISPVIAYDLPTSAYVQRNLVEQWDGLENAGRGKPHDSSLNQWNGLVGGKVLAFSTYAGKNFNENSLQSLSGSYYIADCKTITTNDFNVFDGFVYEATARADNSYEPLFGSNSRIIWLRSGSLGLSRQKAYSVTLENPAGNKSIYAAYVPGTDIPSSVYVDGEQLTTEVTPNPNNIAYFNYLSIGLDNQFRLRGGWYALRLYKKELSEAEQTVNRLVDKVRFELADPAEFTWPTGMRIKDGVLEVCFTVTFNEKGSVTLNGETVESGVPIWVEKDSPVTLVATPEAACKLKTWSGYYFDDLPVFERQDLEFSFIANMPADLGAQFVDESAGIWNIPGDFDTLAEALASNDVTVGDTIRIASGEYAWDRALDEVTGFTYLAVVRKAVKIEGVGGADAVTLDCGQEGGILLDNPDAVLSGITFKNFTINKNVSSRALCVTQGVATNIIVNGAGGSGSAMANVVYIDTNGTLMDSEVRGVTNGLWGGNQVDVRGGTMKRVKVFACKSYAITTYFDAGFGGKRALCEDCDFINNCGYHGNGSCLSVDFVRCRFVGNDAYDNGILLTLRNTTTVTLTDCVFTNNNQVAYATSTPLFYIGGGATQFLMTNCLIAANSLYQGGVFKPNTSNNNLELINCTVYGNESRLGTVAGITQGGSSTSRAKVTMRNTIFRNNLASGEDVEFAEELPYVDFTFDHSCYTGRPIEEGSIDEDPKFKDAAAGDYMLDKGSPCVDTGVDIDALTWDLAGNKRPVSGNGDGREITDMGCYEKPEPTEALEVGLDVEVENDCAPGQATLTATVTGTKTTGLEYQWYWICTVGGTVTTNKTGWVEDATYTFTNLGVGSYAFGCNVKNDATPPDTATGEGKNAVRILPETTYVSTTGSDEDNFPYDSKEKAAGTLATAYANAGRKVVILPGTYTFDHAVDEVTGLDCQLAVRRAITITSEGNPSEVILDCQGKNAFIVDHAQAVVSGFTLKNFLTVAGSGPVVQVNLGAISNVVVDGEIPATVAGDCISLATGTLADSIVVTNLHAAATADPGLMPFRLVGATMRNSRVIGCLTGRHNNRTVVLATAGELSRRSRIENCLFVGNENTSGLGLVDVSRTDIIRCVFMGNLSKCSALTYSTMVDSIIVGNNGSAIESNAMWGGGIYHNSVTNCLVANNQIKGRPAVYAASGTAGIELINCTIANNESTTASLAGGVAISGATEGYPTQLWLKNCIVWGNSVTGVVSDVLTEAEPYCSLYINNSCFSEAAAIPNAGNIAEDPLFRAPTQNNFTLRATSPCVDKGDNLNWKKKTDKDLLGQPRIQNRIIDMGCYEVQRVGTVFFIR